VKIFIRRNRIGEKKTGSNRKSELSRVGGGGGEDLKGGGVTRMGLCVGGFIVAPIWKVDAQEKRLRNQREEYKRNVIVYHLGAFSRKGGVKKAQ